MKKLVLFDLDGTLVNAGGAGRTALRKAMEELYGVKPEFEHGLISGRTDLDNFSLVYSLIKKGKKPTAAEMKKMKAKYLELLPAEVHVAVRCKKYDLTPGVEMLQAAVKRAEKKFKTKIAPENVFVIGDTHRDICAAKNCGFHSAVLTTGFGEAQKIQRAAAELETKDFNDLVTFCVWLGIKTDPKGVKRGSYIMPASAIEHVFFSRTGIDEDRLKMLRIKKYSDLESGTIM